MSNWDHELGRQFGNKNIEAGLILYLKKNVIYEATLAISIFQPFKETKPYDYIKKDKGNQTSQCTFTINTEKIGSSQLERLLCCNAVKTITYNYEHSVISQLRPHIFLCVLFHPVSKSLP